MRWWQCRWQWRNTLKWSRGRMLRKWRLSCLSPSQTSSPPDTPSVLLFIFSCFSFETFFTGISPSLLTAESFLFNDARKSSNCPISKCVFVLICKCSNVLMCVCVYVLMHVCSCVLMYLCAYMLMYVTMHVLMCEYVNLSMFYCVCAPVY